MTRLDLSRLTLERPPSNSNRTPFGRRRWGTRYVLPAGIVLGFVVMLGAAAGHQFLPKPSVSVLPVIVKTARVQQEGTPLFQAAGWIEPRPTPVSVAAMAPGVVEALLVVEGQQVAKGEPVARLIAIDAELEVQRAKVSLEICEGELQRAQAALQAAVAKLEHPVHLTARLADAKSQLAKATTEKSKLPYLCKMARANVDFSRSSLEGKQAAGNAIARVLVEQAKKEYTAAQAELEELQQREPNIEREVKALKEKVDALETQLRLMIEEKRMVEEAKAKVLSAMAVRDKAKLQLREAELLLQRTVVLAPMNGRILRLIAFPGSRVMGLEHTAGQSSSTVLEMYDPERLQVRADVRLENLPLVQAGAPVKIETASSGKPIVGRVLQTTSSANIQKNTLEVKVEIIDPPPTVSPEMLVTATFVAPEVDPTEVGNREAGRVFVPAQLVQRGDGGDVIWVVDADRCAVRKSVQVGSNGPDGLVEIRKGLNVTDKLISSDVSGLSEGGMVTIRDEDRTIGVGE